ncbi:MAG: hypothetical protein HKL96_05345 [Phycisphaerales bacterium]|nr:hypothetical protein [Phycisphaerales bacterium]
MTKIAKPSTFDIKPQAHLVNIIRTTRDHHPNFVLFLGAGASVTSKVEPTSTMIDRWRSQHYQTYGGGKLFDAHLASQPWYNKTNEYSLLFEQLYDQPSQRREFIEYCLKEASPSWGYIFLVNLLDKKVFNTVFTTNFDDLLNEACYTFSQDVRPIVCAHDSSIRSVRITSKRPKIIKLHGDFLFDNIKNTVNELESLENNMKDKFKQYAAEFGFIVVGYAGNDRSVIEPLNWLLSQERNFPHGIYWCIPKNAEISENVQNLVRFPRFHLIEIEGFDELFAEVHEALDLKLQPEMSDPYNALSRRLNNLIQNTNIPNAPHPIVLRHIQAMGERITRYNTATPSGGGVTAIMPNQGNTFPHGLRIPYVMLSQISRRNSHYDEAVRYLLAELTTQPSLVIIMDAIGVISEHKLFEHLDEVMKRLRESNAELEKNPNLSFDLCLPLIVAKKYREAREVLELGREAAQKNPAAPFEESFYWLNLLQIKVHEGKELTSDERQRLEKMTLTGNELSQMGAHILLQKYKEAESYLKIIVRKRMVNPPSSISNWPIIALLKPHLQHPLEQILNGGSKDGIISRALLEMENGPKPEPPPSK